MDRVELKHDLKIASSWSNWRQAANRDAQALIAFSQPVVRAALLSS
jgi:hypothetical protein